MSITASYSKGPDFSSWCVTLHISTFLSVPKRTIKVHTVTTVLIHSLSKEFKTCESMRTRSTRAGLIRLSHGSFQTGSSPIFYKFKVALLAAIPVLIFCHGTFPIGRIKQTVGTKYGDTSMQYPSCNARCEISGYVTHANCGLPFSFALKSNISTQFWYLFFPQRQINVWYLKGSTNSKALDYKGSRPDEVKF
jgi:hypothetical protein